MKRWPIILLIVAWFSLSPSFDAGAAWQHKNAVDTLLEQAMIDFSIPGMSVVVIDDGEIVYSRGLGYRDLDPFKPATPNTVYRIASVSKAVAGVIALDLEEQGGINLNRLTRDYVPTLPAHHTHRVWHTIANRSGFGHYDELPEPPSAKYIDALTPLKFFWNAPLMNPPGKGVFYSTHGYTALGAAIESATGQPLKTYIANNFTEVYGLPTLRAESRHIYNEDRSAIYKWDTNYNKEVTADILDWKIFGGGFESSAVDLARFGMKLIDGDILTPTSLHKLWTPPDTLSNYAYGWNTAWENCTFVVAKDGAQKGAKSYLRMYPTRGIVIAVLTNRKNGGHSPKSLAKSIGSMMLNEECQNEEEELLKNRSFENAQPGDAKQAKFWTPVGLDNDVRVVSKPPARKIAFAGNAAFRFKGDGPIISMVRQEINDVNLAAGDRLILSGWIRANKMANTPRIGVELRYDDGTIENFLIQGDTGTYAYRKYVREIVVPKAADQVYVYAGILSDPGRFFVDGLSLYVVREGGSSAASIPLPAAPADTQLRN